MVDERELTAAVGSTAYGSDGEKLGRVEHFFSDDRTGVPTWVAVATGLFGTHHSVVPAVEATFTDGALRLPVTREAVRTAPAVPDDHLDPDNELLLRRHYGLDTGVPAGQGPAAGGAPTPAATPATPAATPGPAPAGSPAAMTLSEERLQVGTERVATSRVRLVKYVVTEEVQVTVPVRREEFRLEEVPLDGSGSVVDGSAVPPGGQAPVEIVLHAERPVVGVEVVPVERVRLHVDVVRGEETVSDSVRRERIDVQQEDVKQEQAPA